MLLPNFISNFVIFWYGLLQNILRRNFISNFVIFWYGLQEGTPAGATELKYYNSFSSHNYLVL